MSSLKAWIEAMRLRTLPVSIAGVIAGGACALFQGSFRWLPFVICLVFAIGAQVASNFANEYFDYRRGYDRKGREGFRRGVTEGDITPQAMLTATLVTLGVDALIGLSLIWFGGWWLIIPGILIAIFALAYSAGPWPLSSHGLGDVAVIIFFGLVPVVLTCYVTSGEWLWTSPSWGISIGIGLMGANVLVVNNYRDMEDDLAVGKRTTVVILGRRVMSLCYLLSGIAAALLYYLSMAPYVTRGWVAFPLLLVVAEILMYNRLVASRGAELNKLLGMTAMLLLVSSLCLLAASL